MATVNEQQISRVAAFLKANPPMGSGMNFYSVQTPKGELVLDKMYPPIGHPRAVDFFFLACLHQYGFWYGDANGYLEPMVGTLRGERFGEPRPAKGSDLLWQLLHRTLDNDSFWEPAHLAEIRPSELAVVLGDGFGTQWPDFERRLLITQSYGRWLDQIGMTPKSIVGEANAFTEPLKQFRAIMRSDKGLNPWADDPLEKKQLLLAMALANRPEGLLKVAPGEEWPPIVDYHLMRVALRLGLVELSAHETSFNVTRRWVWEKKENSIRDATWKAVHGLIKESGLSMAQVDETLWMARKYCPEMEKPDCDKCLFSAVCARRTDLFQPVIRTTAY